MVRVRVGITRKDLAGVICEAMRPESLGRRRNFLRIQRFNCCRRCLNEISRWDFGGGDHSPLSTKYYRVDRRRWNRKTPFLEGSKVLVLRILQIPSRLIRGRSMTHATRESWDLCHVRQAPVSAEIRVNNRPLLYS